MSRLPRLTGSEIIAALGKAGFAAPIAGRRSAVHGEAQPINLIGSLSRYFRDVLAWLQAQNRLVASRRPAAAAMQGRETCVAIRDLNGVDDIGRPISILVISPKFA
jgi:hypothetical protein